MVWWADYLIYDIPAFGPRLCRSIDTHEWLMCAYGAIVLLVVEVVQPCGNGWEKGWHEYPLVWRRESHEPYGPRVVWVQLDSPAGCIIISKCRGLGHDHAYGSLRFIVVMQTELNVDDMRNVGCWYRFGFTWLCTTWGLVLVWWIVAHVRLFSLCFSFT